MNQTAIVRIAAMGNALRPDWPHASLVTTLSDQRLASRAYRDVAVAMAWIATDDATKTPARIFENGPWWGATGHGDTPATPTAPKLADLRCKKCGGIKPEGDEKHREHCKPRTVPTVAFREAKAKAAGKAITENEETTA